MNQHAAMRGPPRKDIGIGKPRLEVQVKPGATITTTQTTEVIGWLQYRKITTAAITAQALPGAHSAIARIALVSKPAAA